MAKYNINDFTILTDSGGRTLITESLIYEETFTVTNTIDNLPTSYFTDYFATPYVFQGSTSGYASGGEGAPSSPYTMSNVIDKFPFASDANATDVGDLTQARIRLTGQSSKNHGYASGGTGQPPYSNPYASNIIDKFSFSSDANATDVGDLTQGRKSIAGQSSSTHGYVSGGSHTTNDYNNVIDKFSVSSDGNATDVGDLTVARGGTGQSSTSDGYTSGASTPPTDPLSNVIDKFPFASDANATDYGDLTEARHTLSSNSSSSNGYTTGGFSPTARNTIEKFPFASSANAADVGDLTQGRGAMSGQNSTSNGYVSGGTPASGKLDIIEKYPFASDANAADVGDLTHTRENLAGQQV